MKIEQDGWLAGCERIPSPNFDARAGAAIDLLVIHNISLPPGQFGGNGVAELFTNRLDPEEHPYYRSIAGLEVSAHFFIRRDGGIVQFVSCLDRAWHAGASSWQGRTRCNDFSIGIELEGADDQPFSVGQYRSLVELTATIRDAYPIRGIAGHSDIAPQRKTDPGPFFDWRQYLSGLVNLRFG